MTLNRLLIIIGIVVLLVTGVVMWLWGYAYSPEGRARVIVAQLKGDTTSLRGWMLQKKLIRPAYVLSPEQAECRARKKIDEQIVRLNDSTHPDALPRAIAAAYRDAAAQEMEKLGTKVLPVVVEAMGEANADVQHVALRFCQKFPDPREIEPVARCMRQLAPKCATFQASEANQDTYAFMLHARDLLLSLGPEAYGPLLDATKGCTKEMRLGIADKMAEKSGSAAFPYLMELLRDPDGSMRASAAGALGRLGDRRATDALIARLQDSDPWAAQRTAAALGDLGDSRAVAALLQTVRNNGLKSTYRIMAASSLARMGNCEGFEFLLTKLRSGSGQERSDAATWLRYPAIHGALEPLVAALKDKDALVRRMAVQSLWDLHDRRAIPAVRRLVNDPDEDVRQDAADALKELESLPTDSQPPKR